jgi:L-threonine kinase
MTELVRWTAGVPDRSVPSHRHLAESDPAPIGSATAFGTFGELLQGRLPDGDDFLVTLPIARWSRAAFRLEPHAASVRVRPADKLKSRHLAEMMLDRYHVRGGGLLLLDSELPEGKGMASSSADLVATARAVARALGREAAPNEVESLLRGIEPTDGVMHDGVVAFHHREVSLRAHLGHLPPMTVVGIDEGGEVSTTEFNRRPKQFTERDRRTYESLLTALTEAIRGGDAGTIGEVATRSALMNQRLCPKRTLPEMIAVCGEVGGLGLVAAHSGTALGILIDDDDPARAVRIARARRACATFAARVWIEDCLPGRSVSGVDRRPAYLPDEGPATGPRRLIPFREGTAMTSADGQTPGAERVTAVRRVWADTLGTAVSNDTDFFDVGGESRHALTIYAGIEPILHRRPPLRVLFENPRFGDFIDEIGAARPVPEET